MILFNVFNKVFNNRKRQKRHFKLIVEKYFDADWYQLTYHIEDTDPFEHFYQHGLTQLKNPNQNFDMQWYLHEYEDVRQSGIHPFFHYVAFGKKEGRLQNAEEKLGVSTYENTLIAPQAQSAAIDLNQFAVNAQDQTYLAYLQAGNRGCGFEVLADKPMQLISMDVWDTVLRRTCHADEIKLASARYIFIEYYPQLKPTFEDIVSLYKARKNAENNASLTDDYEYRYHDALDRWLPMVFLTGIGNDELIAVKNKLLQHEFNAELRAIVVDTGCLKFLQADKDTPRVFASDFYMPKEFIQKLLTAKGLDGYFVKGYTSCDEVKNKRSGALFSHIINDFQLCAENVLHIGDNRQADVHVPSQQGIHCVHYVDTQELAVNTWLGQAIDASLNHDMDLHQQRIMATLENLSHTTDNELQQIGMRFSPVIIGLILFIIETAKKLKLDTVYFFTREGIFLQQIYALVTQADPYYSDYPKSEVLEVSRLATFAPSLEQVDQTHLMRLWSQYAKQSVQAICASLNIDSDKCRELFAQHGFDYEQVIEEPWHNLALEKLFKSYQFKQIVADNIEPQRALLKEYLLNKGINADVKDILIVDLGWRGTIQDNLAHLLDCRVHGCYLGLMGFFNPQPDNVSKHGYLFDRNQQAGTFNIKEVGPLEMLCNALSGSTTGYQRENSQVVAIKKTEVAEDAVFSRYTQDFQQGITRAIQPLVDYIAIHALTADALKPMSIAITDSLLENPPALIAEAFFALTHNETFGTGAYQKMQVDAQFFQALGKKSGSYLHNYVSKHMQSIRWSQGFLNLPSTQAALADLSTDMYNVPIEFYQKTKLAKFTTRPKVALFSPSPLIGSGGHRTLFNLARKLIDAGCELHCFVESIGEGMSVVHDYLGDKPAYVCLGWPKDGSFDLAIATIACSAAHIAKMQNVKHKAYLVQDFEAWFNPVGDQYCENENSYTYGLQHFTVGKFLTHVLNHQYQAKSVPSGLGVDNSIYFDQQLVREEAICFLYQPEKDRRNPKLAINALRIVKACKPEIKIYVYGSDAEIELDFAVENLGLIRNLAELNDLYNKCKVGLCISMSNPSRIPFEFMSAGVVPVDIYRYNNLLDYPTGTIKLAYQSHESIAEAILQLFNNPAELASRKISCMDFTYTRSLDWEMDTFVNCALSMMQGQQILPSTVMCTYNEAPVLATADCRDEVYAFCAW